MPVAAKAFFVVTAGIFSDEPMPEYSRQWGYTSQDYEADSKVRPEDITRFAARRDEAISYARDAIDPSRVNWVRLEFMWL